MSRNGTKPGRTSWVAILGAAFALACGWPQAAQADWGDTCYWKSGSANGNWDNTFWYNTTRSWDNHNPGYVGGQDLRFDNTSNLDMTNNWSGAGTNMWRINFISGTGARTIYGTIQNTFRNNGTPKIENGDADAQVIHFPFRLETAMEVNPVSGNLTLHGAVDNNGQWINVWGDNQKYLYWNGVLSGSGGLAVKQNSVVVLTNNNTFTGAIWIEKGTVVASNQANSIGQSGILNVGTNATLDLAAAATMYSATLNLYGTGTNSDWGALRKTTGSTATWPGAVTLGADSKIVASGGITFSSGNVSAGGYTLYVSNSATVQQTGGEITGTKTTGDGAIHKTGSGTLTLRPGSGLTGSILLHQGEIRQSTGNSSVLASGGTLVMSNATTYRSDSGTARTVAKAARIDGNVTLGYSGGGRLTFSGNVDLNGGTRIVTNLNDATISGILSNGGLTKAGALTTLILLGANTYASGTTISAGTLQIGSNGTAGAVSGNVVNNAALVWYRSDSPTYAGQISGTGTLDKQGAGTLTLSGISSMSGATTVSAGTLLVASGGSLGSSAVSVSAGATLAGAGTVGSIAALAGTVSPGDTAAAAGTLTVSGAAALGGGAYTCDVTGTGSTACDLISAGGAVAAASALTINLPTSAPSGFDECASYSWTIMSGTSASAANMSVGTKWTTSGTFGVAAVGNTIVATYTPGAPAAPTVAASDGTSTAHAALSWADVSCETGYVIKRNTANDYASATAIYTNAANATTYNDTSATAGTPYYYWVAATNAGGSTASASDLGYKRLTAPANVAAADGSSTANVAVTWDAATGATAYHVWRDTDSNPTGATALGAQTSGFADTPTAGQLYYYWVVASNSASSSTSDLSTANSGYRKLTAPAGVAATENLSDRVTVTWTDSNAGETGYGIWRFTSDVSGSASCIGGVGADVATYDDTTATAGQTYYYWVRATNSTSASQSDFSASDTGLKTLTEPTTAASAITFSSLATVSYTVGWTRGNGDYVLVVARQGGAPTDPTDSTVYAANAAFGSGDATAAGSYVVYKGTGTSVPVTGLSAGTEYSFAVYEFSGDATPNYRTSDEPVASRTTLVAEPTTQATGITVTGTNEVTLTGINWTDGNGASRLVVVKAGSAVDGFPVDGTSYTANAAFGSGSQIGTGNYVVHAGSGPLATLSGLSRDVVYHIRVFEFNGSAGSENYLTNSAAGNPISQTTMADNPATAAADLAISAIGTASFTVTWTKGTAGTNTLILVRAGSLTTEPSDLNTYTANTVFGSGSEIGTGGYVVYTNTGTSVTITGLTPGTRYYVKAYAFNGAAGAQNYRTSDEPATDGYTLMTEPTQATSISFGTLADTSLAVSYTAGNGLSRLVVAKAGSAVTFLPADGTAYAGENNNLGSAADLGGGNFLVHRGASPFTLSGLSAATEYHVRIFDYQGTNTTLNYNTNAASGNPGNRYTLSAEPTVHGTLSATAASDTAIDLSWGDATGESGFVIVRQTSDSGWTAPSDGTAYSAGNSLGGGTVVYAGTTAGAGSMTDSSLSANTTYYYRIYPYAYDGTPAHATYNYYAGGTPGSANATTGPAEPATSSTLTSFLPASGSSATIVWTNTGSADGTIILVKSGSAVSSNPSDWNGYAADTVFGGGDEIGTGNFVVVAAAGKHGSVTVTGLSAGTTYHVAVYPYNGTGAFLNYRTTAPATGSATILPDPSAQSATADGKTLVDLAWTKNASYDVMIVHKTGSASTAPTQGAAYGVGSACGGGTVIYKGSGAALEHVAASGTTHHYAFYSYSGDYYSAGVVDSEATTAFAAGEIVDTFSYTNGTALTGLNGETGWGGAWYGDTALFTNSSGSFATQTNYPAMTGNKLWVYPPDNTGKAVYRPLGQDYKSGRLYFGYVLNYTWNGPNKYEGLSFFESNTAEKVFFGEIYGSDQILGIDSTASAYGLTAGSGNDYVIVGYYDWAAGEAKAKAYKIGTQAVPIDEPASWDVTVTKASNTVGTINNVRLAAGAGASDGTPGNTYFDEVRIATNWAGIVQVAPSKPADPSGQSATADGSEMARLAWAKNGSANDVMIVHKTSAITVDPTDGTSYSAGNTVNGGTVIYKGGATALEHVVSPGTTNFYKFYSVNGANYYSTGVVAAVTNAAYGSYEKVNPFSYTNGTSLGTTTVGGQGFGANYWTVDSGTWTVQTNYPAAAVDSVPKFLDMDGYPDMQGNLVYCDVSSDGGVAKAQRSLASTISGGQFYVAFMMSYQYRGSNKWAGVSLLNASGTEKAFLGKGAGANWSTLGIGDGSTTYWSAYDMGQFYSSDTFGSTGNVYLLVGKYDFDTDVFQAKAYRLVDGYTFPETEPSWDVSQTMAGIDAIARIQLNAGATAGAGYPGKVFYDEIRYATNWAGLIAVTCPTWAGSNSLDSAAWTAPASTWLGDTEDFQFQSTPVGLGQSGAVEFDWARSGAFASSYPMAWWQNANNNSYWTNQVQLTAAGVVTSRYAAAGSSCGAVYTNNPALTVQDLNPPTGATATRDAVNTNSQINLEWVRGTSGVAKDVIVVRQTADAGWTAPVNGTTYNAGDALGSGTVVYRGDGTTASDTGLAPSTTYYYRFYSENWTYYSVTYDEASAATAAGTQEIAIDGNPADWRGSASAVLDTSASSLQEYIWTDKLGELRVDPADHQNADIREFRVYADADWVYFLVRLTNVTDVSKPFVAIGVDTRTNSASTAMNWLGDDSGTFVGDGYFAGGAAHFPEYQLNIHSVGGAQIEAYKHDGTFWYGPGATREVAIDATYDAIEVKVARSELNLSGTKVARFTVAAFLNTGVWNNDGDGTTHVADNTAAALDTVSIAPWNVADNSANLSAWLEDVSDADVDFWVDVKFGASGLVDNSKPSAPVLVSPTNTAAVAASPNLVWNASTDSDGQITGYLLEISTNEQFNGASGTENGTVDLRVNLAAGTTNYAFTTSATQYWWRVRARDTAGELSAATTRWFRVVGKLDTEGPQPTLLYIGTNVAGYLAGDYDAHIAQYGPIQSVLDSELRDTNNVFGFVLRWEDASGVYATNHMRSTESPPAAGGFAFNIVSTDGRVSPNWDIVEYTNGVFSREWGIDVPFYATNTLAAGNGDLVLTNYAVAAFSMTNYDPTVDYYLTVSAEDAYSEGGSWWSYGSWSSFQAASGGKYFSGWCEDGPNTARNITTNLLIEIHVTDDDIVAPSPSQALGWSNNGTNASMVVSNHLGRLAYVAGEGQDALYQVTDGSLIGHPLSFSFNAYDSFYQGVALGTAETYSGGGRTLTNTSFVAAYWQTNWANYSAAMSLTNDTTSASTMLTWHWASITTQDVTKLWGPDSLDGELGVTNLVQLDLFDVDNDRSSDQANVRQNFGRIVLVDDDAVDPVVVESALSVVGTGLAREYALTNLVEWTFPSGSADLTASAVAAGVTSSPISLGPMGSIQGTTNLYANAAYYRPGTNRYWLFTLTPATTDKTFKAISVSFDSRVSSLNGPDTVLLYGTMPGGAETLWASNAIDLSDAENPTGTNWNSYSVAVAMPAASTGTVAFKLLGTVSDTNHLVSEANANWYVDNIYVSGYVLGPAGGTQITDQDLAYGTARFSLEAYDNYSGLDATIGASTGRAPRVDFWNVSQSVVPVTNAFMTNGLNGGSGATTGTTPIAISGYAPAADKKQVALGAGGASLTYYARFTANDFDVDRAGDDRAAAYTTTNTVYDEDGSKPARGYLYGGPLGVYVDGVLTKAVSSGNSREYRINDEQLQTASATSIAVKVNLYDYSGWTVPALSFSNSLAGLMSTNGWLTSVHTDDVNTTNLPEAAMEWCFGTNQAATLFNSYESVASEFAVASAWDKDDDRLDSGDNNVDNLELAGARVGYLTFLDNDVGQANVQSNYSATRATWTVPKVYLGLPGDAARSNLYVSGLPADTGEGAVLSDLTNRVYDSQLAKVSAAAPLSVVLPLFDTGGGGGGRTIKGVQRGTSLTQESVNGGYNVTNSSLTIGTVQASNATNYRSDLSSSLALTRIAAQFPTSTWAFTSFSYAQVGTWLPAGEAASSHVMTADLRDADDNRPNDQKVRSGVALGTLRVIDNDTVAPVAPTNVKVNGQALSGPLTRDTAAWTNQPTFRVSFSNSVDGAPAGDDLEATGIGEYRTATVAADIGPDLGVPLTVPAEGALANYGFESGSTNWTLSGAEISTEQAYEGTHSVKMTGSSAQQTVYLLNTNGYAPRVAVMGAQFMGGATVTGAVTVTGLDANGTPVGGAAFTVSINGTAGQWVGATATSNVLATTVDRVQVTATSGAGTYWDDIRIRIDLLNAGVPVNEVNAIFTAVEQGLVTNYLFAVDRDNNRGGDRKASSAPADAYIPAFGTAYDVTAPTYVPVLEAATDEVDDPTTQFDVSWNSTDVGPDRLDDANHPDFPSASNRDLLSPWRSYKIYYGTFDPLDVPPGDPGPGNGAAYIYTNYIATGAYTNWLAVSSTNAIADPSAAGTNYLALTNRTQGAIRLYDLDFDQDYAVVVVGLDKAGNEGPASPSSWATNNTIKFAVTQGTLRVRAQIESAFPTNNNLRVGDKGAIGLFWIAAGPTNAQGGYLQVNKEYDLIWKDAGSFQENSNWVWQKVGTVQSNWFTDAPGQDLARGNVRFYRASYKDRWRDTNVVSGLVQRPLASEEVYALHNVVISEGRNHVGLHGEPYTNTFAGLFGTDTNLWPAGASAAAGATKIEFYSAGTNAPVSEVYFFGTDANWYKSGVGTPVTSDLQASNFFTHGFSITLPTNLVARGFATTYAQDYSQPGSNIPAMVWHPILKVPTNGFSHTIACGKRGRTGDPSVLMYNVLALNLPVSAGPAQLNFPTNFTRGLGIGDEIYTIDTSTKDLRNGSSIYCDASGNWFFVNGGSPVPSDYFKPNDLIVIVSRNGGLGNTWTWTYHPTNFYNLPTRWMGN